MNIPLIKSSCGRPLNRANDCAVIALSNALNISYIDSELYWASQGRKHNQGTFTTRILGKEKIIFGHKISLFFSPCTKNEWKKISLNQFITAKMSGVYLCETNTHIFAIKDGVVLSANNEGGKQRLTNIWKCEKTIN